MADATPIRPQRIIRANRETTGGLLMSVIRSLTTSRDSADRDRERLELEKGFQQCDQRLNELIGQHCQDLCQVMNIFSKILGNLSRAKERLIDTRDKLLNCQKLLHCKRDELKKLWLEIVENRAVYELLEMVEQVARLPGQVQQYADKKYYLHAAQCCVDGLTRLGGGIAGHRSVSQSADADSTGRNAGPAPAAGPSSLAKIEALTEVRAELVAAKESLFERAMDELHRHLYQVATEDVRRRFHQQQQMEKNREKLTSTDVNDNVKLFYELSSPAPLLVESSAATAKGTDNGRADDDFDAYPEEDSRQFISMLTKCVGLLDKISDAVRIIRERFDEEFVSIVIRTAQDILQAVEERPLPSEPRSESASSVAAWFMADSSITDPGKYSETAMSVSDVQHQQQELMVLTCTRLLGHRYDGYSHLADEPAAPAAMPRTSVQLRRLFVLLMKQFDYVIHLHDSIVLSNLRRIESGLHMAAEQQPADHQQELLIPGSGDSFTSFYQAGDVWSKMQLLVQQLLDFYLDISQISGQAAHGGSVVTAGLNLHYNHLMSSLLPSAAVNMLFGSAVGGGQAPAATGPPVENYSSFFMKRRPMMVTGAMNAMNAVMSAGKNADSGGLESSAASAADEVGSHFFAGSRGPSSQTHQHHHLFKFDNSSQAMSWNSFLQQQQQQKQQEETETGDETSEPETGIKRAHQPRLNINNRLFDVLQQISPQTPDNLVLIYDPLLQHIRQCAAEDGRSESVDSEEENASGSGGGGSLRQYLAVSSEKFNGHLGTQLDAMLEQAQKSLESGATIVLGGGTGYPPPPPPPASAEDSPAHHDQRKQIGGQPQAAPLLHSAVMVDVAASELAVLMVAMPDFRDHYLGHICNVLNAYKETAKRLYDTVTTTTLPASSSTMSTSSSTYDLSGSVAATGNVPTSHAQERQSIISANWARDEDINRLLRSLPNWLQLQDRTSGNKQPIAKPPPAKMAPHRRALMIGRQMSVFASFDESPEDVRLRNVRETEILINSLAQERVSVSRYELLWQEGQLSMLAHMQQSFEWLARRCDHLAQQIQRKQGVAGTAAAADPVSEVYIATLNQLSSDFDEIGRLCLLVLHLEVRVHCFYHLQALDAQFLTTSAPATSASGDMSDDAKIKPLLEDLQRMYGELSKAQLSSAKMAYIFEGLGHLIATIFINAAMSVRRVKPNGIKRACRAIYDIQRRLTTITKSRELALDYARQYFEMLLLSPEEIFSSIIERRGQQFERAEYVAAITLLHQSGLTGAAPAPGAAQPDANGTAPATVAGNALQQHESNQQLQRLLKRLNDILNEVDHH